MRTLICIPLLLLLQSCAHANCTNQYNTLVEKISEKSRTEGIYFLIQNLNQIESKKYVPEDYEETIEKMELEIADLQNQFFKNCVREN